MSPTFDEIMAEAEAQAAGADKLRRWNDLIAAAERLGSIAPLAATKVLAALADIATAYAGGPALAAAVHRLTESAANRMAVDGS